MLEVSALRVPVDGCDPMAALKKAAAAKLRLQEGELKELRIVRRSIDARKKPSVCYEYTVAVAVSDERALLRRAKKKTTIRPYRPVRYAVPQTASRKRRPIVVGFGPAGMFAAYLLALAGADPIVLERGREAEQRQADVGRFFAGGRLDPASNVQFGEGGAGTFSDGKLATARGDREGRNRFVLETFCKFGADERILYDAKPHVGTDRLIAIVQGMRREIVRLGGTVRFASQMESLVIEGTYVRGVRLVDGTELAGDRVILAIGHSARDTFAALYAQRVAMQAKPFAVGVRVEHPQAWISRIQYGDAAAYLPAAPYKLVTKQTSVPCYSFCMCPGGYVINASSEPGRLCVNGMSNAARDGANANSALVIPVGGESFDLSEPLAGLSYQRALEEKAYARGEGAIPQQLYGDFLANRVSASYGGVVSQTKGAARLCNLRGLLSERIERALIDGIAEADRRMPGYLREDMVLSGVESRTSSPVRLPRDASFQSERLTGLYPCGEGAGYAGGITSAAMDGLKTAEAVLRTL